MRIAITGANGHIGSYLVEELGKYHEIVTFGRSKADVCWSLGVIPDPKSLDDVDVVIHLAWSLRDRIRDQHLNVGGTLLFAQRSLNLRIPFLFISTLSSSTSSHYVRAKREAEEIVKQLGGSVLRIGLIPDLNSYAFDGLRSLCLPIPIPNFLFKLPITEKTHLLSFIDSYLCRNKSHENSIIGPYFEVLSYKQNFTDYFSERLGKTIKISPKFFLLGLRILSPFSLQIRNFLDAILGVSDSESAD